MRTDIAQYARICLSLIAQRSFGLHRTGRSLLLELFDLEMAVACAWRGACVSARRIHRHDGDASRRCPSLTTYGASAAHPGARELRILNQKLYAVTRLQEMRRDAMWNQDFLALP